MNNTLLKRWIFSLPLLLSFAAFAGDKIDEVIDVSGTGQVNIENMRGKVEIVGWSKDQMSVSGELDDLAQGYTFTSENGFTQFKVKMPKHMGKHQWNKGSGSKLKIQLPQGSEVIFESVNGNVTIKAVAGGSDIHTVNGNIEADALSKRVKLETVNGNIVANKLEGKVKLSTVNGRVKDQNSTGKVSYNTVNGTINSKTTAEHVYVENVNGEIDLDLQSTRELEVATVNGNVDISLNMTDETSVIVTTVSGNAKLAIGGTASGLFSLSSHAGGQIRNRLSDDEVVKQKYGPGRRLKFKLGGGDAKVEMTSVSGNLTIERK